jgi:hypothetical protein
MLRVTGHLEASINQRRKLTVGVEHVGAVVVGVVDRSDAGRAIIGSAGLDRCRVEGIYLRAALGPQRNVKSTPHRLAVRFDKKRGSSTLAEPSRRSSELHEERHSERCERSLIERFASLVVGNGESDVIHHPRYKVWCLLLGHLPRIVAPLSRAGPPPPIALERPKRGFANSVLRVLGFKSLLPSEWATVTTAPPRIGSRQAPRGRRLAPRPEGLV